MKRLVNPIARAVNKESFPSTEDGEALVLPGNKTVDENIAASRARRFAKLKEDLEFVKKHGKDPNRVSPAMIYQDHDTQRAVMQDYQRREKELHSLPIDIMAAIKHLRYKQKIGEGTVAPINYAELQYLDE